MNHLDKAGSEDFKSLLPVFSFFPGLPIHIVVEGRQSRKTAAKVHVAAVTLLIFVHILSFNLPVMTA